MSIVYKIIFELSIIGGLLILRLDKELQNIILGEQGTAQDSHDLNDWATKRTRGRASDSKETAPNFWSCRWTWQQGARKISLWKEAGDLSGNIRSDMHKYPKLLGVQISAFQKCDKVFTTYYIVHKKVIFRTNRIK